MASQRRRSATRHSQTKPRSGHRPSQLQRQQPTTQSPFHYLHQHLLASNPPPTLPLASVRRLTPASSCHTACVVLSIQSAELVHTRRGADVAKVTVQLGDDTNQYVNVDLWGAKARWAECLQCGDLVYWHSVKVNVWRDRVGLQTHSASRFTILERRGGWDGDEKEASQARNAQATFAQRWRLPFAAPLWLQQHMQRLNQWVKSQHGGLLYLPPRLSSSQARQRLSTPLTPSPQHTALDDPASLPPLTLYELLHGRLSSGYYRLACRIRRLYFPDLPFFSPSPSLLLSSLPPLSSFSSLIYRGCHHCGVQLKTDADGVWRAQCGECEGGDETLLASDQAAAAAVSWYYRPMHIQVVDVPHAGVKDMWLQLSHSVMLQLLVNLPASLWVVQEQEKGEDVQQQPAQRRHSSRRSTKRRRQSQTGRVGAETEQSQLPQPTTEPSSADRPPTCSTSTDGRVLSCSCQHQRCQWLGLLCALVSEADEGTAAGGGSGGAVEAEEDEEECAWTLLLRVDVSLDDNSEVQDRHHVVVGCSIQRF